MFVPEIENFVYEIIENIIYHSSDNEFGKNYFSTSCDQWKNKR